jgi:hypothetical protein
MKSMPLKPQTKFISAADFYNLMYEIDLGYQLAEVRNNNYDISLQLKDKLLSVPWIYEDAYKMIRDEMIKSTTHTISLTVHSRGKLLRRIILQ